MINNTKLNEFIYIIKIMKPKVVLYFIGLVGHSGTEASITIILPFIMKFIIDATINGDIQKLKKGVLLAIIQALIVSFLFMLFGYLFMVSSFKTIKDIRIMFFKHILNLPVSYFEQNHSGDTISRATNDMKALENTITWPIRSILYIIFTGVGTAAAMIILNWKIGFILMLTGVISCIVSSKFAVVIQSLSDKLQVSMGKLTEYTSDILGGFSVIKNFQIENVILEQFNKKNNEVYDIIMSRTKKNATLDCCNYLVSWFNIGGIISIGSLMVVKGYAEFGTVIALMNLLGNFNSVIRNLGGAVASINGSLAGATRVIELINEVPEPSNYNLPTISVPEDTMIYFKNVNFSYKDKKSVLNSLNIRVKRGQIAALVGPSGGGKSTIIKLLLGFYSPNSGGIAIDQRSVGNYTLHELRCLMSYVPQDAYMFDGTIEENLKYGNLEASKDEIISAAKATHAHKFIEEMPEGYYTVVGERGVRLSGGQRQRIAIARAVLMNAPILLMDEATSSLDSQSEQLLQDALNKLMKGRTVLTIAHRLSTIEHADIIYVINEGKVVEQGKHEELLNKNMLYSALYTQQFKLDRANY